MPVPIIQSKNSMLVVNHFFKKVEDGSQVVKVSKSTKTKMLNVNQINQLKKLTAARSPDQKPLEDRIKDLKQQLTKRKLTDDEEYVEIATKQHKYLKSIAEAAKDRIKALETSMAIVQNVESPSSEIYE